MKKKVDLKELDLLEQWLKDNGISYERFDQEGEYVDILDCYVNDRHQICVPFYAAEPRWDVICHYGSYGWQQGLLESYGLLADRDNAPIGWLTAEDVIRMLKERGLDKWQT